MPFCYAYDLRVNTETPSDWRRLFSGHASEADAYRILVAAGGRGSFVAPQPDRTLVRVDVAGARALKCSEHGALIPSDMADAVHDEAVALARAYAESKSIQQVRYRVELVSDGDTLGKSRNRWAPIDAADVPEDDGSDDSAKELRALALLRHADRQIRELHKLNLEQAERYVQLAEQHGSAVHSYNETLLGMVNTIAAEREASSRPATLDPEVAREGLELARTFLTMQMQAKAREEVKKDFPAPGEAKSETSHGAYDAQRLTCARVLESLEPEELELLRQVAAVPLEVLEELAACYTPDRARVLVDILVGDAPRLMANLPADLLAKLHPLGALNTGVGA